MKKLFAKEKTGRAILTYSIIFIILSIFIYLCFSYAGKSFVSSVDAINQHFVTLKSWRSLLLNFFKAGEFNTFTWRIGNGIDLFADYGYYIIGDFISYLSVLVPEKFLYYFYTLSIFIRFYLIGISFIIYAKYKKYNNFASINGAICYTFMSYSLALAFRHPYFANAFILFPLLLLGMDKIVLENKKVFYIFMIFISFVSSFYFAYIMSLCLLIYGLILIISTYKKDGIKVIVKNLIKVFLCSIIGIIMSSFVLLPILNQYLNSNRGSSLSIFDFKYNYAYYASIARSLATFQANQLVALGLNPIILIALPIAIKNYKKNYRYLLLAAALLIVSLLPFLSGIFAGFSFPTNRHVFVISLVLCLLITELLNNEINLTKKDLLLIIIFNLIYFAIAFHYGTLDKIAVFSIMCVTILLLIFYFRNDIEKYIKKTTNLKKYCTYNILVTIILVCITANRNNLFFDENRVVEEYINSGAVTYFYNTNYGFAPAFDQLVSEINDTDNEFYKIGKTQSDTFNDGLFFNYNTISYYYSIVPGILQQLPYDLSNIAYSTSMETSQFNHRTKITTLLGTKYYVMADDKDLPYGYKLLKEDESNIYQNRTPVPFATYYDKYINTDEYENLDNLEKESSLLKNIVLSKNDSKNIVHNDSYYEGISKDISKLEYQISNDSHHIAVTKNGSDDEENDNKITITIEPNQKFNGEIYLKIDNIELKPYTKKELYKIKTTQQNYSKREFDRSYEHYDDKSSFI